MNREALTTVEKDSRSLIKKIFEAIAKGKVWITIFCIIFAAGLIYKWFIKGDITSTDIGILAGYIFTCIGSYTATTITEKKIKNGNIK